MQIFNELLQKSEKKLNTCFIWEKYFLLRMILALLIKKVNVDYLLSGC